MEEEASNGRSATLANQIRNNINCIAKMEEINCIAKMEEETGTEGPFVRFIKYVAKMEEEARNERSATLANQIRNNIKNIPKMEEMRHHESLQEETRIERLIRPYKGYHELLQEMGYHELLQEETRIERPIRPYEARNERLATLANQIRNNIKNIPEMEEMRHHELLQEEASYGRAATLANQIRNNINCIAKMAEEASNERSATLANQIRNNMRHHELLQERIDLIQRKEREARNERLATLANQIRNNIKYIPEMEEMRLHELLQEMRHHELLQERIDLIQRQQRMRHHELLQEAFLNADTSEVKMIFGKQEVHFSNRHSCHGTKLLKSSLSLAPFFLPFAGGAGHGSGQAEHQGHSEIYPSTLNDVSNCPSLGEYMQRSFTKCADVCGSYMQDGNCAYHCMRDSSKTKLVEFCAKPKPLFDFCPEYDPVDQTIQKDLSTLCNSTFSQNYYNSSDIYFCDPNNCLQLRESSVRSGATTLTTLMNETTEMNDGDSQELFVWLFVGLAALTLAIIIGYILQRVFVRLRNFSGRTSKMTKKRKQNGKQYACTETVITDLM